VLATDRGTGCDVFALAVAVETRYMAEVHPAEHRRYACRAGAAPPAWGRKVLQPIRDSPEEEQLEGRGPMSRSNELTDRQRQIYEFLMSYLDEQGFPPTVREICRQFDIRSTKGVTDHLSALERKGYIKKRREASRGIEILNRKSLRDDTLQIPILGQIAAGVPLLAVENHEGQLVLDRSLAPGGTLFALRVKGDSMINAHILDGDLVVVRAQEHVDDGEIAAVRIDDEATVKRLYRKDDRVILKSENETVAPMVYEGPEREDIKVLGKVAAVVRRCCT
jgi:repressor LexA